MQSKGYLSLSISLPASLLHKVFVVCIDFLLTYSQDRLELILRSFTHSLSCMTSLLIYFTPDIVPCDAKDNTDCKTQLNSDILQTSFNSLATLILTWSDMKPP